MPSSIQPRRRLQRRSSTSGPPRRPDQFKYSSSSTSLNNEPSDNGPAKPSTRFASSPGHRRSRPGLFVNTDGEEIWPDDHGSDWESTPGSTPTSVLPNEHRLPQPRLPEPRLPQRFTYSSLPPTPLSPSPPPDTIDLASPTEPSHTDTPQPHRPFSLWDYLREELVANDFDEHQEMKWERVANFLSVPVAMEKIMSFGFFLCLDSFLYTFTILPLRFVLALLAFARAPAALPSSQKADILRALLLLASLAVLVPLTDASKIYHSIRGQDTIKLYVIFNALEIGDRLLASIGQDILDCLFSPPTLAPTSRKADTLRPISFFILAVLYAVLHTLTLLYQTISLNVAVNSYDYSLLTLLVSNQFVEIKGSVFKKFEKDNLFQITCADIVERFTLSLMLIIVAFRNLIELSGSATDWSTPMPKSFLLPKRFSGIPGSVVGTISYPVLTVLLSETLVDWLKHAFITKFNHIRPSVYERYTDVLCGDLRGGWAKVRVHSYVDQSPLAARRLGFAALPLANLALIIGSQCVGLLAAAPVWEVWEVWTSVQVWAGWVVVRVGKWAVLGVLFWVCAVAVKLIIGINLLAYASKRRAGVAAREAADAVNDWGRDPIGEGAEEKKYNRELKKFLDDKRDDTAEGGKKRLRLEEITRFTMVKRIW
ncbi:DUF747-domain-containing protein [Neolentinus lepideus HHB14362 ss-1]|uniref:DUF747-domain-containing protein n=1 Tax=Neolentinus lepideus HHB14362 ss-1 TaxID=1314782 RepID=A0A165TLJ9_9AGAM|nr:DUF747-domain-containing protein [Neolentinus lepideus HHB14362 ss-1]